MLHKEAGESSALFKLKSKKIISKYPIYFCSYCESPFFEGFSLKAPCDSYHMNLGLCFVVLFWELGTDFRNISVDFIA